MGLASRWGTLALLVCLSSACGSDDDTGSDGGSSTGNDNNTGEANTGNNDGAADAGGGNTGNGSAGNDTTGGSSGGTSNGATGSAECLLRDDMYGPGQYTSSCVKREWIEDYAGTYESSTCTLTVELPNDVAARLKLVVRGSILPGDYACDWEGGGNGSVNDSYYRFTTDATFATTKDLNFTAAMPTSDGEMNIRLRVNGLDKGAPTFTGGFTNVVKGVNTDVDCGTLTKK